jgi:hypothetical protein
MGFLLGAAIYFIIGLLIIVLLMKRDTSACREYCSGQVNTAEMALSIIAWPLIVSALTIDAAMRGIVKIFNL